MEREKMIEEMLKALEPITCFGWIEDIKVEDLAKKLIDLNICKIPDGSVVLTREELDKLHIFDDEMFERILNNERERGRKETAREILSELREFLENRKHRFDLECNAAEETAKSYDKDDYGKEVFTKILHKKDAAWCECDVIESKIDNLVKKYGVEVK